MTVASGGGGAPEAIERRLVILMAARLALAVVSLVIALALDALVADFTLTERRGFYGTVAFAFLATALYGLLLPRIGRASLSAAVNIATDIAIVSALVHLSGGQDSPFTFLYVLVAVYGAILYDRRGALATAATCALAYGAVLLAGAWFDSPALGPPQPGPVLLSIWIVHAGALLVVAALSSFLSTELRHTGEELRRRTSDLRHLQTLYQHTVESLMSGLLTTDLEGRVTSFNPEAEKITRLPAAEALGREVDEIIPQLREHLADRRDERNGGPRLRLPYRNRAGEELHLGVAAYILRDADAAPIGSVVIFQDVTQVVAMERELRRSERLAAVGELSASIAHEIRNPLAAISGSIQVLRGRIAALEGGGDSRRLMDIVLREVDRLNDLITDFLLYARPGPLKLASVPLRELIEELLEVFRAECPDGLGLVVDVDPAITLRADPGQLRQALWNLVRNAAEAMPEGGTLTLSGRLVPNAPQEASPEGRNGSEEARRLRWAEVGVSDEGTGIPRDTLDRIFDPFFTTKREGSGLGLATVHRIVEHHGGVLRLETCEGEGTTLRMWLPLDDAAEERP